MLLGGGNKILLVQNQLVRVSEEMMKCIKAVPERVLQGNGMDPRRRRTRLL